MKNKIDIVFLELPFDGFTVNIAWIPYDKAASEIARNIVKESFLHKRKLEKFIADKGVKKPEVYLLACGKEYSIKRGFTEDFELVNANLIIFDKPFRGVFDRAIHIALIDEFENYEGKEKLQRIIFFVFFHELLHAICEIKSEKKVDKITEEFRKAVLMQ